MILVPAPMLRGFTAAAVDFDGTNDYMARGANPTGLVDGKAGLLSTWFRLDGGDGSVLGITANGNDKFSVTRNAAGVIEIVGVNAASATILNIETTATYAAGATWRHLLATWNLAVPGARHIYVSDVAATIVENDFVDDTIDYANTDHFVGSLAGGGSKFNGGMAEFFFNPTYLDITVEANRRLFIDASGRPVDLGPTGAIPLGSQPLLYFGVTAAPASGFATNKGSGGDFTVTGTLDMASTSPSG